MESSYIPKEIADWWTDHKEWDRIRRQDERKFAKDRIKETKIQNEKKKLVKSALAKLSQEEKNALGFE